MRYDSVHDTVYLTRSHELRLTLIRPAKWYHLLNLGRGVWLPQGGSAKEN